MAEALAAVGLVSNIIQNVEVSTKVLLNGRELFKSAEGVFQENVELGEIAVSIKTVVQNVANHKMARSLE